MKLDKTYKVKVNRNQSKEIQQLIFALGGQWASGGKQILSIYDEIYLIIDENLKIMWNSKNFDKHEGEAIESEKFITLLNKLSEQKAENYMTNNSVESSQFKVGDRVYFPIESSKIHTLVDCNREDYNLKIWSITESIMATFTKKGLFLRDDKNPSIFLATKENYELLSKLYPNTDFEKPELTGSDLCRYMFDNGWKFVPCYVSYDSDDDALSDNVVALISSYSENRYVDVDDEYFWKYAVPIDPKTGDILKAEQVGL